MAKRVNPAKADKETIPQNESLTPSPVNNAPLLRIYQLSTLFYTMASSLVLSNPSAIIGKAVCLIKRLESMGAKEIEYAKGGWIKNNIIVKPPQKGELQELKKAQVELKRDIATFAYPNLNSESETEIPEVYVSSQIQDCLLYAEELGMLLEYEIEFNSLSYFPT